MRNARKRPFVSMIAMPATALVLAATVSGCHWFSKEDVFAQPEASRPLEVPPDLDLPDTEGAMALPGEAPRSVTRSSMSAAPASNDSVSGFNVAGDSDDVYAKVGDALAAIPGVTIASRAQVLGAYDVSYEGSNFLVRVSSLQGGAYVSAVDPRGVPATSGAPVKLIAALKAAIGG